MKYFLPLLLLGLQLLFSPVLNGQSQPPLPPEEIKKSFIREYAMPPEIDASGNPRGKREIYRFQLNDAQAGQPYKFVLSKVSLGDSTTPSCAFELVTLDMTDYNDQEVFETKLTYAFFDHLNGKQQARVGALIDESQSSIDAEALRHIRQRMYEHYRTNLRFDDAAFLDSVRRQSAKLTLLEREGIMAMAEELVAANRSSYDELRSSLISKGYGFLLAAERRMNPLTVDTKGTDNQTITDNLYGYDNTTEAKANEEFQKEFAKSGRYLNRKPVSIGNQTYSLQAKAVVTENGLERYIFSFALKRATRFFEMESLQATANNINGLANKMKQILGDFKLRRTAQLSRADLNRITEIANRLERNPKDYGIQDDKALETIIENAADNYGFSVRSLREELRKTGIFAAIKKRAAYAATKAGTLRPVDLERKINEGAVTSTRYVDDVDKTLRDVAADFLFTAYKNSIVVEADSSYIIGNIKIAETVNFYRRGVTFERVKQQRKKASDKYVPIGKVKFKEAQVEFENEQIRNIEFYGKKQGKPKPIAQIRPDQNEIYMEIDGQVVPVTIPSKEDYQNIILYGKWDRGDQDAALAREMIMFNEDNRAYGELYVWGTNYHANVDGYDVEKKKGSKNEKFGKKLIGFSISWPRTR